MIEIQKSLIVYCIKENNRVSLLFDELFEGSLREIFQVIKKVLYQDSFVSIATLEHYITNNHPKLIAVFNSIANYEPKVTFQEAQAIAIREYNKGVFRRLIKNDIGNDIELYDLVFNALSQFRRLDTFCLNSHVDKAIHNLMQGVHSKYRIGIDGIDETIDISPDRFITIGGASGSGKTAFVVFLIDRLCSIYQQELDVLFISLEMSEERIINRLLSLYTGEHINKIRKELMANKEYMINKVLDFKVKIGSYPLEILYTEMDINKIDMVLQTHINKARGRNRTPVLFLDHFGEVAGLDEHSAKSNTDKITMALKNYVKRGGISFGLTQLRKDLKDKKNKEIYYRPSNNYIMNSQSVEARSDMILHLWRPEQDGFTDIVYEEAGTIYSIDCRNSVCLVNDKNRDNEKRDIWLNCNIAVNHFEDINKNKIKIIEKGI